MRKTSLQRAIQIGQIAREIRALQDDIKTVEQSPDPQLSVSVQGITQVNGTTSTVQLFVSKLPLLELLSTKLRDMRRMALSLDVELEDSDA